MALVIKLVSEHIISIEVTSLKICHPCCGPKSFSVYAYSQGVLENKPSLVICC